MIDSATLQNGFNIYLNEHYPKAVYGQLKDSTAYYLLQPGKQFRALLVLLSYSIFDKNYQKAYPAALAIETFHNFTLVHDDIMDNAPTRRGKPSLHERYSTNTAILSGDLLLLFAYQHLFTYQNSAIVEEFTKIAVEICEGQEMDMSFQSTDGISYETYIEMLRLKTAVLVGYSLKLGALLGGATEAQAQEIYLFGEKMGIAFQLQDDVFDVYSDAKFGKQLGGDIIEGKKTALYFQTLAVLTVEEQLAFQQLYYGLMGPEEKVIAVKQMMDQTGAKERVLASITLYKKEALQQLSPESSVAIEDILHYLESIV